VLLILLLLLLCLLLHHHHHRLSRKYISSKNTTSVVLISLCSNTESGSSTQGIQYIPSGDTVFESQTGSSQGNAGNFQFSSGEDTLENYKGILSGNGASEGSTGVLSIPGYSPALPQFNTLLPEPYFYY